MSNCRENCTVVIPEGQRMGYCDRHRCKKTASWVKLCQRDQAVYLKAVENGSEIKTSFWTEWEAGRGPGQVKPGQMQTTQSVGSVCWQPGGAGTELKKLLARFGIVSHPNCQCAQRAREMDSNGIVWCEEYIEEIADWLEEEAHRRGWPFIRVAARILIRRAIKNAKRKAK